MLDARSQGQRKALGIVLNGTSSLLYGTVPDLAPGGDTGRAFAIFYTSVIGSGGLSPILYGAIADHAGRTVAVLSAAATAGLIIPLVVMLGRSLINSPSCGASTGCPRIDRDD